MRNNLKYFLLIFFISSFFSNSLSEEIKFDDIKFEASTIEYFDKENIIKASGEVKIFLDEATEISAEKFTYDRSKYLLIIEENVELRDFKYDIFIKSNKINYSKKKEILSSDTETSIFFKKDYVFNLTSFTYDRNKSILFSKTKSEIIDKLENNIQMNEFNFEIINKLIKSKFVKYIDKEKNRGKIKNAVINVDTNAIVGNEFEVNFNNSLFGNSLNDPRLKSKGVLIEDKNTTLSKAVFTTCKKNEDKCPPWKMQSEEVFHDKKKKTLNYKNAWLNIYDVPVVYFPKFFHPDPTVKRQSGFLIPTFAGSKSLGQSISIPYFNAISENKDLTFSPRVFFDGTTIIQNEYRQANKQSNHLIDSSFLLNSGNNEGTKSHFFLNSTFNLSEINDVDKELLVKIESVSNDTYLKKYDISSPIKSDTDLNSKIELTGSSNNFDYVTSLEINENLNKSQSDRYEYVFPNFSFTRNLNDNFNILGNLDFISTGHSKLYDTNVQENILINNLQYESENKISKKGFVSNIKFLIKNFNSEAQNSSVYKSDYDSGLMGLFAYENKLPLINKKKNDVRELFTPKLLFNFSPNKTKNMKNDDRRIDVKNIFSFNRISSDDSVEGGESLTLGAEYRRIDNKDKEYFGFDIGSSFRTREDQDMPLSSTLGKKTSDIYGNLFFKPTDNFKFDYNYSLDNSLDTINFHSFKTDFKINNFFNTFEYFERSDVAVKQSFYKNTSGLKLDDNNSIKLETRKNKTTDLTEYYNLIYEYKNDCLTASIEYDKDYYTDADLQPEETLLFKITIVPFTTFENIRKVD
tara:strand:+ start:2211 stop:4622 length:2412 start_codon:yes stop_codon:yes gene_type:complete